MSLLTANVTPFNLPLSVYQGATFKPVFTLRDKETDTLINLTGCTARMKAKTGFDSSEAVINLTTENGGITLGGTAGTITLLISAANTASLTPAIYIYDLEIILASAEIVRVFEGSITVYAEVTK